MPPKLKVLIVDDNRMDRMVVRAVLNKLSINDVIEAENGVIAEGKLVTAEKVATPFDLVILDWNMKSGNGLSVLKKIRQDPHLKTCKVIIMTATAHKETVEDAIKHGANDFITKPVVLEVMQEKLKKLLAS